MTLIDFSNLFVYSTFLILITMLVLCYRQTEEHFWLIVASVLRILVFTTVKIKALPTKPFYDVVLFFESEFLIILSAVMSYYVFTYWIIPNSKRYRKIFLITHGVVLLASLIPGPTMELFQTIIKFVTALNTMISIGLVLKFKYRNPFLRDVMSRLFGTLAKGMLFIFTLVLLFDPFFESIQFLRPLYTFSFPFARFSDSWMNIMFAIIAYKTIEGVPRHREVTPSSDVRNATLTPREKEVLELLLMGKSNSGIAKELKIAMPTTKTHIGNIYKKLGVASRHELLCQSTPK